MPAVITNPDRPAGRGMELRPSPVKIAAEAAGIEVLQPRTARDEELHARLTELAPDVAVVVAYGKLLPPSLLGIPPKGFVNVHFSLLPHYRGAAPVQRAVMEGERTTGVSIMVLTEGMDEGPVLARKEVEIEALETAGQLGERLAGLGAPLLAEALSAYVAGDLFPEPQDHEAATYAPKITTDDARIDWTKDAAQVANLVRGLNPDPVAWTTFRGGRVRILGAEAPPAEAAETGPTGLEPGELSAADDLYAGTSGGPVRILELQMPGKKPMKSREVVRGLRLTRGERFE